MTNDQGSRLIQSLLRPQAYPHPTESLSLMETHISWIILTGQYAYKIKKPVNFGFVDFSSLSKRQFFCQEELRLNQRFSSDLYLSVVGIAGPEHQARIDGKGKPIEYALKMREFSQRQLFESLLADNGLRPDHIDRFAGQLAEFHSKSGRASPGDPWGTRQAVTDAVEETFQPLLSSARDSRQRAQLQQLQHWNAAQLSLHGAFIEDRRKTGFVRECHGDLHLGNLVLLGECPTAFDCIEFNENLRWIDVVSEIAFLGMDLEVKGSRALAYRFLNQYQMKLGDYRGLRLWDFYRLYRAMVRAKVSWLSLRHTSNPDAKSYFLRNYQRYLDFGLDLIQPTQPLLIITHGLSGSGKSHLAAALCERLPAIWLRSDIERKRIVPASTSDDAYGPEATRKTYLRLRQLATELIVAGLSVIVDATFLARWQRQQLLELARKTHVQFAILDIQTPMDILEQRILQRGALATDPSEATLDVLKKQLRRHSPLSDLEQQHALRVDGQSPDIDQLLAQITMDASAVL